MSVVLMVLIGGAIQFYGRDMNLRDMDVRQTQLAGALLQMIEDDLRGTVFGEPADMSPLETLLVESTGGQPENSADLSAAGIDSEDDMTAIDSSADLITSTLVLQSPGLIGGQSSIQFDLSRLPRLEEYQVMMDVTVGNLEDVPSDLKTVAYFVQDAGTIGGVQDQLESVGDDQQAGSGGTVSGGLVRRSIDRSATVFAATNSGMTTLSQSGDLLAPEVTSISFQYFDGINWLTFWNSDDSGQLPYAVKVQLTMADDSSIEEGATRIFSHVVRLPMAREAEETSEEDTESEEMAEAGI
ncbi:prepilin-type cleavage/methylation domain-containing protein [Rubripirellula obstinata]|nr:prepilin-type cleavage/methylation domain-containing protein [Rubripirellula obstinata]